MKLSFFFQAFFAFATTCLVSTAGQGEVRLASVITDHAVLQRDVPIHLWGEASPGEKITITFHGQSIAGSATTVGLWEVWLKPEPAGGPFTLTVRGSSELTRSDLLVGDVWFASGQSNMEMPLAGFPGSADVTNADQEIAQADLPQVRLLRMEHQSSASPLAGISAAWQPCTPATARNFSAVAYFFAREISRREHVPIGVIDSSWGGTSRHLTVQSRSENALKLKKGTADAPRFPQTASDSDVVDGKDSTADRLPRPHRR
jgi:sialate O-acetylesterase